MTQLLECAIHLVINHENPFDKGLYPMNHNATFISLWYEFMLIDAINTTISRALSSKYGSMIMTGT